VVELGPDDPRGAVELLRAADAAMYRAKAFRAATRYAGDHE
jgi:PleD family two-component response regulator